MGGKERKGQKKRGKKGGGGGNNNNKQNKQTTLFESYKLFIMKTTAPNTPTP